MKYLVLRNSVFWVRRRVKDLGEINFSLDTKDYKIAVLRLSYINYQIERILLKYEDQNLGIQEVRSIVKKYVDYMVDPDNEYCEEIAQREQEIELVKNGQTFKGHTKKAINKEIKYIAKLLVNGEEELLKEKSEIILSRSNIKEEFDLLSEEDKKIFIWELLKGEITSLEFERERNLKKLKPDVNLKDVYGYMSFEQPKYNNGIPYGMDPLTINELVDKYIDEKRVTEEWSDRNEEDIHYVLDLFSKTFQNKDVNLLTRDNFTHFRNCVLAMLPANVQSKAFNNKSALERIIINKTLKKDTIDKVTINKHLGRVHQVFEWGNENGYVANNLTKNLRYKIKKDKQKDKDHFTDEDLNLIFHQTDIFSSKLLQQIRYKPSRIFVPLIVLYSAGRNDEICQLYLDDIKQIDGVWCIDINDELDKKVKADSTSRIVPIHNDLIELGFLKYVEYQRTNNEQRLFPELKKGKNGYSTNFTSWFSGFKIKNFPDWGKKKTFYSFKHTFIDQLKQKTVPLHFINAVAGHKSENIDDDLYGGELSLENKVNVVNQFSLELDLSHIKQAINIVYS